MRTKVSVVVDVVNQLHWLEEDEPTWGGR